MKRRLRKRTTHLFTVHGEESQPEAYRAETLRSGCVVASLHPSNGMPCAAYVVVQLNGRGPRWAVAGRRRWRRSGRRLRSIFFPGLGGVVRGELGLGELDGRVLAGVI